MLQRFICIYWCYKKWSILVSDGFGSIFCSSGRVSHSWFGFEFGKFPLKMSKFSLRVKKISGQFKGGSASYLLRVKSKLGSGPISTFGVQSLPWKASNILPLFFQSQNLNAYWSLSKIQVIFFVARVSTFYLVESNEISSGQVQKYLS